MKYTPRTTAKSLIAALFAFVGATYIQSGGDISAIDPDVLANAAGVALLSGGGTFVVPNKPMPGKNEQFVVQLQDVKKEIDTVTQQALDSVAKVQEAVGAVTVPSASLVERAKNAYRQ